MNNLRLSTLETLISIADHPGRPLDFALILDLKNPPDIESLKLGALSARSIFPTTSSVIRGREWLPFNEPGGGLSVIPAVESHSVEQIEEFLDRPLDPKSQLPVQQLMLVNEDKKLTKLVTRFHHTAVDGLSAAMWLGHQLRMAYGIETSASIDNLRQKLSLRKHDSPVRKSKFAFKEAARPLQNHSTDNSHKRRWSTFHFSAGRLRERCRRAGGFTYNDLLMTCLLEALIHWQSENDCKKAQAISLWLPVNIRQKPIVGFGNGTSRVRIYAGYADTLSLGEKCREIRRQIAWSLRHGEWAVPERVPLEHWPLWAAQPLIRSYLNRPGVDMCTVVFSHLERLGRDDELVFKEVERIECVGLLHRQHSLAVNGSTQHGRTWLTLTYDPNLLSATDIERLIELYKKEIARALREL